MKSSTDEGVVFWVAGRPVLPGDTIVIPLRIASIRSRDSIEKSNAYLLLATPAFSFFFLSLSRLRESPKRNCWRNSSDFTSSHRVASPQFLSIPRFFTRSFVSAIFLFALVLYAR